jgi:thiamine-monophosphate kinase
MSAPDEFEQIARLFRPLTRGAAEALDLLDDAAVLAGRPGMDLVITKDAMVEGVHFLPGTAPGLVARKLVRVNLSDLAAKGAEPYGYFLAVSWPPSFAWPERQAFAEGLREDGEAFGLSLLGGDTTSTPGPLTCSMTMLGWVPAGGMIRRAGARPGDLVMVSGAIGDGVLGLAAARAEISDPSGALRARYELPVPRTDLRDALRAGASAACDVSDGLVADLGHIARASGVGISLDLARIPLSPAAQAWAETQPDRMAALVRIATGGDDYEVACTGPAIIPGFRAVGEVVAGEGVTARLGGVPVEIVAAGWRHR